MSLHQANLLASAPERAGVDLGSLEAWRAGELDLARALAVSEETITGLRHQALALFEAGKWSRVRDVVIGLAALGTVHVVDALLLARALAESSIDRDGAAASWHSARLLVARGVIVPETPTIDGLRALLDRLPADSVAEAKAEWEQQRRLTAVLVSYESFTTHLAGGADAPARVELALRAAGPCAATNTFPRRAAGEAARLVRAAASSAATGKKRAPHVKQGREDRGVERDPLERLQVLLGESSSARISMLRALGSRVRDRASFDADVFAFAELLEQATYAPSYCLTRMGWHYPRTRPDYRARRYEPAIIWLSEPRWSHSCTLAERGLARVVAAADPEKTLAALLIERFFDECGFDPARMHGAPIDGAAIRRAITHELVVPLRALNETILDLDTTGLGTREDVRRRVDELMISLARGTLPLEPFWATKLGHPADGFDVAGHELLRILGPGGALSSHSVTSSLEE